MESLSLVDVFWCFVLAAGVTAEVMDRVGRRRTAAAVQGHDGSYAGDLPGGPAVGS